MLHQHCGNDWLLSDCIAPRCLQAWINSITSPEINVRLHKNTSPAPTAAPYFDQATDQTADLVPNKGGNKSVPSIHIGKLIVTNDTNSKRFENTDSIKIRSRERGII